MDHDDDDFSRHNLQLASESRSRSSSVLRPYDFPKFDFDDNLQGHLRFDSLVETEVFLGIQSQEDNQWIEDYSRVSNGMEFNPDAADSCSISRRDNVWSEATSSESVEMLLKSVGQEEMVPVASIILETNARDDQGASGRHVESGADQDMRNTDTMRPEEEVKDYPTEDAHMEELPHVGDPSSTPKNVGPTSPNPLNFTQDSMCAMGGISANEGEHSHHSVPADGNIKEPETTVFSQVPASEASLLIDANVSRDDGQERHKPIGISLEDTSDLKGKTTDASIDTSMGVDPCSIPESRLEDTVDAVKASLDFPKPEGPESILNKEECQLTFPEGDEKNASRRTSVQTHVSEYKALDGCHIGSSGDGNSQLSADLSCSDRHCTSPEQKRVSPMELILGQDGMLEDMQTNHKGRTSSENLSPVEDNEVPIERGDCINVTDISKSDSADVLSSDAENKQTGNLGDCGDVLAFHQEGLGAQSVGNVASDSGQDIEETVAHAQADFSATGSDLVGKHAVGTGNMGPENSETVTTELGTHSVCDDEMIKGNDIIRGLQNQTSAGINRGDVVPHAKSNDVSAVGCHAENGQSKTYVVGFEDNDSEKDATKITDDANFRAAAGSVSEVEGRSDTQSPLSKVDGKSLQAVEKCNEMSSSKSLSTTVTNSLHLDNPEDSLACEKLLLKGNRKDEIGCCNHELTIMESGGGQESAQVAEIDKSSCGSPTIISSSEPSRLETDDAEETKGSEDTGKSVKDSQATSEDVKGKDFLGDDNSFTFKVNAVPDAAQKPEKNWSLFRDAEKCNSLNVAKEVTPSGMGKTEKLSSPKTPRQSARVTDAEAPKGTSKGTSERKGRRAPGKGATKESAKKGTQAKGTNQDFSTGTIDKGAGFLAPSNRPDVNASALTKSASMSPTYRQPFTDLQQVQLRAQIFVYGSLIQGTAPDEACMVSAFGPSGRSSWDPVWRTAVERVRTQKCSSNATETPLHVQSGVKASDSAVKQSLNPSKVQATPVNKVSSKDSATTMASPIIPLSSPLWSVCTPSRDNLPSSTMHKGPIMDFQQTVTPLHSYQTPPIRSFIGHTSWPSQTCFPGPWLPSPQTNTFSSGVRFQPLTFADTGKSASIKDISLPITSGVKHLTSSPVVHTLGPSPVYGGLSPLPDTKSITELHSGDLKSRKRKKITVSDPNLTASASVAETLPVMIHSADVFQKSPVGTSVMVPLAPDTALATSIADGSTVSSIAPRKTGDPDFMKAVACSEETLKNVVEAKTQAENAADSAAAAVIQCEDLWGKLAKQKEAGLSSEVETKLSSAAAAIAAAASVAKAAAAAAKVAFNAALQAKLMADEALLAGKPGVVVPTGAKSCTDVQNMGNATPASILKGEKTSNESSSILVAAKEAAKRRVEAASAASKQAENLDAIVKAAELAAGAVSQAGIIVAMGEPLPLVDLVEAGPDGYWKLPQTSADLAGGLRDENKEQSGAIDLKEFGNVQAEASGKDSAVKGESRKGSRVKTRQSKRLQDSMDTLVSSADGIIGSLGTDEKESRSQRDTENSISVVSEPDTSSSMQEHDNLACTLSDERIKEGSPVEVFKRGDSLKSAWYSANVLKLDDGKAYVCYSDLSSEEGSGNLCEWIRLESDGEKAPVIRVAHPLTSLQYQGTRKRRRAALGDYAWCVGDKVDVWIDDCWWEGEVTEKNEKDETTLKVYFPAQGDTSTVRAWNLRTSRSWIDGKWVEWSSWKARHSSEQSDTPQEKRQKLGSPTIPEKEKDKLYNEVDFAVGNLEESKRLPLSTSERTFDIGKSIKEDNKLIARRPLRSGQQKEGSRVVFGVPKPTGKKRKFMDVSKHFPANKGDTSNQASEQVKFGKYLNTQATGSQGWKVPSRNVSRERKTVESRPRVPSTRKSHRTLPQRDNLASKSGRDRDADSGTDHGTDAENSVGHDDDSSEKMTDRGFSLTNEPSEASLSSLLSHSSSSGSKKASLTYSRSERLNRGKLGPGGKLSKIEEDRVYTANSSKFNHEANEPRRSNRRFQPTHRLLEGLQSSMVIPKMPSVSNDKGLRKPSRSVFTRGR